LLGLSGSGPNSNQPASVEEFLAFIEGDEAEGGGGGGRGVSGQMGGISLLEAGPAPISTTSGGGGAKSTGKKGKRKPKKPVTWVRALCSWEYRIASNSLASIKFDEVA
jgi:hypothetical protein